MNPLAIILTIGAVEILGFLIVAHFAPDGFENETGFHYGAPPKDPIRFDVSSHSGWNN